MKDNPHSGHRFRLRERFRKEGFSLDNFEAHNVLELMLFYCLPQRDTNALAHALLEEFGSLSGVLDAPYESLLQVDGVGEGTAVFLKLLPALLRSYEQDRLGSGIVLESSGEAKRYFASRFAGRTEEVVFAACLDAENRVRRCELIGSGTVSASAVNVRKIVECAMKSSAHSVIIAHNHPFGTADASPEDIMTTDAIGYALRLIGIPLKDHIIVAKGGAASLADLGIIGNKTDQLGRE